MSDNTLIEVRELLAEIRELLLPITDAYRPAHERRLAIRAVLSTDKRKKAWALATGELSQRDIAKKAGMDEGSASRFFRDLRELGAVGEGTNPKRTVTCRHAREK